MKSLKQTIENQQIKLDIQESYSEKINNIFTDVKFRLKQRRDSIEVSYLKKNFFYILLVTSILVIIYTILHFFVLNFEKLPPKIPLFFNDVVKSWDLVDKSVFVLFLFSIIFIQSIFIYLSSKFFFIDKRFVSICWILLTVINILFLISILQITKIISI